jgi:hypothetical protein
MQAHEYVVRKYVCEADTFCGKTLYTEENRRIDMDLVRCVMIKVLPGRTSNCTLRERAFKSFCRVSLLMSGQVSVFHECFFTHVAFEWSLLLGV